jgi:hypothetical protein
LFVRAAHRENTVYEPTPIGALELLHVARASNHAPHAHFVSAFNLRTLPLRNAATKSAALKKRRRL